MKNKRGLKYFRPLDKSVFQPGPGRLVLLVLLLAERARRPGGREHRLAGRPSETVRLPVRADRRRLAGHRPRLWRESRLVCDGKEEISPRHEMACRFIRRRGLMPGIWVIPFATSDDQRFRPEPDLFIRRADGSSVFETDRSPDRQAGDRLVRPLHRRPYSPESPGSGSPTCSACCAWSGDTTT